MLLNHHAVWYFGFSVTFSVHPLFLFFCWRCVCGPNFSFTCAESDVASKNILRFTQLSKEPRKIEIYLRNEKNWKIIKYIDATSKNTSLLHSHILTLTLNPIMADEFLEELRLGPHKIINSGVHILCSSFLLSPSPPSSAVQTLIISLIDYACYKSLLTFRIPL